MHWTVFSNQIVVFYYMIIFSLNSVPEIHATGWRGVHVVRSWNSSKGGNVSNKSHTVPAAVRHLKT